MKGKFAVFQVTFAVDKAVSWNRNPRRWHKAVATVHSLEVLMRASMLVIAIPLRCGLDHDDCPGFAALPNRAEELLAKHDFTSLRQLITENNKVVLNTERQAIQFVGCDGFLSAHIALTKAAFAQLAE
jgi:hypothetical protein